MPYTFNSATHSSGNTATVSGYVISSGQSLVIFAYDATTSSLTLTLSDGTNTYTSRGTTNDTNTGGTVTLLDCLSPTPGTYTITLGGQASAGSAEFLILNYSGIQSYSAASLAANHAAGATPTTTDGLATAAITPSSYPAMIVGFADNAVNGSYAAGTGFTQRASLTSYIIAGEDLRLTSGSHIASFTYTGTGNGGAILGAAYIETPPPSGPLVGQTTPTTGGSGNLSGGNNGMIWDVFTAYASGTATSINIYITSHVATTIFVGLYNNTTGALLASGSATIANGLNTIAISATITYGQQYALAWQAGNTSSLTVVDDGTNNMCFFATNTAGSLPNTLPAPQSLTNLGVPSIYVVGTLNPGAQGTPLGGPSRAQWHWRSSGGSS